MLTGIHGNDDGTIGRADPEIFEDYVLQVEWLKARFAEEIHEKGVKVNILDVGGYVSGSVDPAELVESVRDCQATVIVLAFCWTRCGTHTYIFSLFCTFLCC